eukprot:651928-Amphidinium_carterae.1
MVGVAHPSRHLVAPTTGILTCMACIIILAWQCAGRVLWIQEYEVFWVIGGGRRLLAIAYCMDGACWQKIACIGILHAWVELAAGKRLLAMTGISGRILSR